MDKVYKSSYDEYIQNEYNIPSIIYNLKTCYYSGELDKFIRYLNDNLPDVNIS
jgi:hypothetical protein